MPTRYFQHSLQLIRGKQDMSRSLIYACTQPVHGRTSLSPKFIQVQSCPDLYIVIPTAGLRPMISIVCGGGLPAALQTLF
jgi:hypothetical protein